jgi:CrcB protein
MYRILLIFAGGGLGSVLRYLVQGWVQRLNGPSFPLGTLVVNVSGCLVIGFLAGLFFGPRPIAADYRFAILTGLLGGYTTFSSFAWETLQLTEDRAFLYATTNIIISVAAGLAAVWLGRYLVHLAYGS